MYDKVMMNRTLSIIIPTYNMAELLPRCLDSIIAAGVGEDIEAIVVNDGSKDNSLQIARDYEKTHPECITVIDKPNGNYGSTINAALPVAKGKYVKILDSDDWFDSNALKNFVRGLQTVEADVVVTHFNIIHHNGRVEHAKYNVYGREPYEYGEVYDLDYVLGGGHIRFFVMHALTYRTELLRRTGYRQSEGVSYTDTQWCAYPLFHASDIIFFDITLYQYNLAREGQTMDPKVIARSLDQLCRMNFDMFDFYTAFDKSKLSSERLVFFRQYFLNRARLLAKTYLYDIPRDLFDAKEFEKVDAKIKEFVKDNELGRIRLMPENKILPIDFYSYWQARHKRPSKMLEGINHLTDIVVKWIYVKIFR